MADGTKTRCNCAHCRVSGLMGPMMLITVGAIFLAAQYTRYGIGDLWPLFLIVPGILMVAQSFASNEGHISP
ncbi:MAG: LiaI-LiaF-like domain-containing protein [Candidatus Acidiferrales bacterium]